MVWLYDIFDDLVAILVRRKDEPSHFFYAYCGRRVHHWSIPPATVLPNLPLHITKRAQRVIDATDRLKVEEYFEVSRKGVEVGRFAIGEMEVDTLRGSAPIAQGSCNEPAPYTSHPSSLDQGNLLFLLMGHHVYSFEGTISLWVNIPSLQQKSTIDRRGVCS
ncbi:hypothetical protein GOBAR_AA01021 [Gossypium barbadense]|uniref:Uncharacterized protein n=1 Tax=Gossypium barbadense TaxID=3634 RepID=A0A2P5YVA7_GOSBA|nr:hypothetical protein GOBAR_AA01021 [Gossypium barbadense]